MSEASRRALLRVRRLAFVMTLWACGSEAEPSPVVLHLGEDTVVLAVGARITDVHVRASQDGREFLPATVEARPGDVLRFSSEDGGPHALVFDEAETDPDGLAFVSSTGQRRSLPLMEPGAAWVVTLADSPAGLYTVRCLTHGSTLAVTVAEAAGR
ncbi:MAG TPA: plastocyanin/azurin family copper-binding protein [Longimicrobiales bacterium]|nr:plastocyanin/azurin family copper-binding protein [Longimicrobiales bacterium]